MIKLQHILVIVAVFQQWKLAWSCEEGEFYWEDRKMCVSCFLCSDRHMKNVVKCAKNISECGGCEDGYEKRLSNNNMCYSVDPAATAEAYKETSDVAVMIDVLGGGLSAGAIAGIVIMCLLAIVIGTIIILYCCNLLPGQKRRHNKPSDLHSESEKGNTSERDSFLDSDAKESSQFGSLTSYLPSVEPSPPHNVSQPYAVSADDATSTHYQASLQSHLPIQSQSTGPLPPILAQPDPSLLSGTQPTSDSSQLPYPVQDSSGGSSAHETQLKTSGSV